MAMVLEISQCYFILNLIVVTEYRCRAWRIVIMTCFGTGYLCSDYLANILKLLGLMEWSEPCVVA
jgi:hypothetical protein